MHRAFEISPTSIYGYALGFLVLAILALIYALIRKDNEVKQLNSDILSLTTNITTVVTTLHTILQSIKDQQDETATEIRAMILALERRLEGFLKFTK